MVAPASRSKAEDIRGGDLVQGPIVNTGPQGPVLLSHEEVPCSSWGCRGANEARGQRIPDVVVHGLLFWTGKRKNVPTGRAGAWIKLDRAIVGPVRRKSSGPALAKNLL